MYGRQPCLPIDVTLGLAPKPVTSPTSTKYVQKLREHIRWAHRKADQFQQKEAWWQKQNYDRCSRAVALREGYTVLVHVTTLKGRHKIQNQWENREYVVEWWPYPNLPVCVVCPRDGEGCSHTLHRNYLLSISNNLNRQEMSLLTNSLQCYLQMVGYQLMGQPRVNQKANLACQQNSRNWSTQN